MIFNPWRKYKPGKKRPKEEGRYLCTVLFDDIKTVTVMDLHYIPWKDQWLDRRRQLVFDGYKVFQSNRAAIEDNRVYGDSLCDLSLAVVAWKNMPEGKRIRKKRKKDI